MRTIILILLALLIYPSSSAQAKSSNDQQRFRKYLKLFKTISDGSASYGTVKLHVVRLVRLEPKQGRKLYVFGLKKLRFPQDATERSIQINQVEHLVVIIVTIMKKSGISSPNVDGRIY